MLLDPNSPTWQRLVGKLISELDQPTFWESLIRFLKKYAHIDNWVVLTLTQEHVQVVGYHEILDTAEIDAMTNLYLKEYYLLDPFFISNREKPQTGYINLSDISPTHFSQTEYYNKYFKKYVSVDESQYNVVIDEKTTLCISLGSTKKYSNEISAALEQMAPWITELMRKRILFEDVSDKNKSEAPSWKKKLDTLEVTITSREFEVLNLILSGFSIKETAAKLNLSTETIKTHRKNIYTKLAIKSQPELFSLFFIESAFPNHTQSR